MRWSHAYLLHLLIQQFSQILLLEYYILGWSSTLISRVNIRQQLHVNEIYTHAAACGRTSLPVISLFYWQTHVSYGGHTNLYITELSMSPAILSCCQLGNLVPLVERLFPHQCLDLTHTGLVTQGLCNNTQVCNNGRKKNSIYIIFYGNYRNALINQSDVLS